MLKLHRLSLTAALMTAGWMGTEVTLRADDAAPKLAPPAAAGEQPAYFSGTIRVTGDDGKVTEFKFGPGEEAKMDAKLKELDATQGRIETSRVYGSRPDGSALGLPEIAVPMYGIGVTISSNVPQVLRRHLKLGENEGLVIQSVADDSPAAKAGLQVGDILLTAGDKAITEHQRLVDAVQAAGKSKKPLSVTAIVAGDRKTIELTPVETDTIEWTFRDVDMIFGRPGGPMGGIPNAEALFQRLPPGRPMPSIRPPRRAEAEELERRVKELEERVKELSKKP